MIEELEIKLKLKERKEKSESEKYDLIDIEDEFLSPEQIKKKRIQKMHKTQSVAREKLKKKQHEEQERIDKLINVDKDKYIKGLYDQRQEIMQRVANRKRQQELVSKRGSITNKRRLDLSE